MVSGKKPVASSNKQLYTQPQSIGKVQLKKNLPTGDDVTKVGC